MKRLILAALAAVLLTSPLRAEVVCVGNGCLSSGLSSASGLTTNTIPKATSSTVVGNSSITDDGTTISFGSNAAVKAAISGASATSNFFGVSGTFQTVNTDVARGAYFNFTGAGSSAQVQEGVKVLLGPGYTGSSDTRGVEISNTSLGTGTNYGIYATAIPASGSGNEIGGFFQAATPTLTTGYSYGVWGQANQGTSAGAASVGVVGNASSGPRRIGGLFTSSAGFGATLPAAGVTGTHVDLVLMHSGVTTDYLVVGPTGASSPFYRIVNGGAEWIGWPKTLTESSATAVANLTVPTGTSSGGKIGYTVEAADASDQQTRRGSVNVQISNKAGTTTCKVSGFDGTDNPTETKDGSEAVLTAGTGTLTYAWTCVDNGSGVAQLKLNAVSSLTQTTLRINHNFVEEGNVAVVYAPQ